MNQAEKSTLKALIIRERAARKIMSRDALRAELNVSHDELDELIRGSGATVCYDFAGFEDAEIYEYDGDAVEKIKTYLSGLRHREELPPDVIEANSVVQFIANRNFFTPAEIQSFEDEARDILRNHAVALAAVAELNSALEKFFASDAHLSPKTVEREIIRRWGVRVWHFDTVKFLTDGLCKS